jgi:protein TonB
MKQHIPGFDDIVFEHRNKSYGAYALRRQYDSRIIGGFVSALILFCGLPVYLHFSAVSQVQGFVDDGLRELSNPEVIYEFNKQPSEPKSKAAAPAGTEKRNDGELPPEVSKDPQPVVSQVDSTVFNENPAGSSGQPSGSTAGNGAQGSGGDGVDSTAGSGSGGSGPIDIAEVMPEFPGGESALFQFLKRKLRFPRGAMEQNREATVYVSFVVYPNGTIGEIESIQPVGFGFDEEVVRVVQLMPRWQPGKVGGRNVAVRYKLPVRFRLNR